MNPRRSYFRVSIPEDAMALGAILIDLGRGRLDLCWILRLEGVGIRVDFEQPNPRRIVLLKGRIEPEASGLDPDGGFAVLLDRSLERFELRVHFRECWS